ncbi:MAG: hypothetical protein Q9227_003644 [Pyrenula ochraceoflavens]
MDEASCSPRLSFSIFEESLILSPLPTTPTNSPPSPLFLSPGSSPGPHPDAENIFPGVLEPEDMAAHRLTRSRAVLPERPLSEPPRLQQITTAVPRSDRIPLSELNVYRAPTVSHPMSDPPPQHMPTLLENTGEESPRTRPSSSTDQPSPLTKPNANSAAPTSMNANTPTNTHDEPDTNINDHSNHNHDGDGDGANDPDLNASSPETDIDPETPLDRLDIDQLTTRFQEAMNEISQQEESLMNQAKNLGEMFTAHAAAMPVAEERRAKARLVYLNSKLNFQRLHDTLLTLSHFQTLDPR